MTRPASLRQSADKRRSLESRTTSRRVGRWPSLTIPPGRSMRGSERDALARPRGPGERDAESRRRGRAGCRPDGWCAPVRDRHRWDRGRARGRCVRTGLRVGVGWQRRRRRRRPARGRFAGGVVELGLARGRGERTGRRGRDRRGGRETRCLPVAGGFARRRPRGGGRRIRAAGRCGPCRTRPEPGSQAQGRGPDQGPVSRRCLDSLGTSGRWRWPGSRWRFLGGRTDRPEPGDRGRTRHPARASARSPRRRSSRRARNSHSPRSRTSGHASSSARRRSRRSRTSSRSPEMGRSSRLAVGAIVAAVAAGQVAPNHLGAAVALALAAVLLVSEARPRLGVAALLPVVVGAAAIAIRLALVPAGPPQLDRPPDGDGPWRLVVESVGSPRDGKQTATLATTGDGPAFRVAATLPRYPVVIPGDEIVVEGSIRERPEFAVWAVPRADRGGRHVDLPDARDRASPGRLRAAARRSAAQCRRGPDPRPARARGRASPRASSSAFATGSTETSLPRSRRPASATS